MLLCTPFCGSVVETQHPWSWSTAGLAEPPQRFHNTELQQQKALISPTSPTLRWAKALLRLHKKAQERGERRRLLDEASVPQRRTGRLGSVTQPSGISSRGSSDWHQIVGLQKHCLQMLTTLQHCLELTRTCTIPRSACAVFPWCLEALCFGQISSRTVVPEPGNRARQHPHPKAQELVKAPTEGRASKSSSRAITCGRLMAPLESKEEPRTGTVLISAICSSWRTEAFSAGIFGSRERRPPAQHRPQAAAFPRRSQCLIRY